MKKHAGVWAGRGKTALFLFGCSSLSASSKQEEDETTTKSEVTISRGKKMGIIPILPSKIFIDLRGFFSTPYEKQNHSFFAFISISPVVRKYYSRDRQWKQNKLELPSLSCDHEYFSIWFSSLLDQSRSFMWDGDANKVMALNKCFCANVIIF